MYTLGRHTPGAAFLLMDIVAQIARSVDAHKRRARPGLKSADELEGAGVESLLLLGPHHVTVPILRDISHVLADQFKKRVMIVDCLQVCVCGLFGCVCGSQRPILFPSHICFFTTVGMALALTTHACIRNVDEYLEPRCWFSS